MQWAKLSVFGLVAALVLTLGQARAQADETKSISGKASCGGCAGVAEGCCLMLTDKDGGRWICRGECPTLKTAFSARHSGKTMTATVVGETKVVKGKDGKEYNEVTVKNVQVQPKEG